MYLVRLTERPFHRYQRLACQARLRESAEQIAAIRRGLTAIIPTPLLGMWTAAEFELAVCGTPNISVDELRRTARYSINRDAAEVGFLFEALEGMTNEERSLFLRFVTGRARLPASIKICSLSGPPSSLPVSHTCFNQIGATPFLSSQPGCLDIDKHVTIQIFRSTKVPNKPQRRSTMP